MRTLLTGLPTNWKNTKSKSGNSNGVRLSLRSTRRKLRRWPISALSLRMPKSWTRSSTKTLRWCKANSRMSRCLRIRWPKWCKHLAKSKRTRTEKTCSFSKLPLNWEITKTGSKSWSKGNCFTSSRMTKSRPRTVNCPKNSCLWGRRTRAVWKLILRRLTYATSTTASSKRTRSWRSRSNLSLALWV